MKKTGNLSNSVYLLRAERRLSQSELAKLIGVSRQTIASLESNKYNPSLVLAFKIARTFDKNVEDIFTYEEE
ncbi:MULTISPECIES: helix-turn-helix transcriptional regulator [Halobacillus]|uniref:helix-turn-helix transcriptional regulator n=1 Tax=Halobacillus TaxID=45667 RepID=UPI00136B5EB6|nr:MULTISPECIES: helix-turn-helix transcriptional regulator [Halobacillus]MYL31204.1 helix-turn-helix domain-containing protein [Halobacillus halophilus]MYL39988.1 helix-turn-helix domain-containing protein [Halobacillus litoralis]